MDHRIKRIQLITNVMCYGLPPEPNEEVEQRLTINSSGGVWFSSYNFGEGDFNYELRMRTRKSIVKDDVNLLFLRIKKYFDNQKDQLFITDVGVWTLNITYDDGDMIQYLGSIGQDIMIDGVELSNEIRRLLKNKNLFAFDGNWK